MDIPFDEQVRLVNSLTLAALPSAVKLSRSLVSVTLRYWGLGRLVEDAKLVVSELVTNAVKATGIVEDTADGDRPRLNTIKVRLVHLETLIAIEVWDRDDTPPKPRDGSPDAECGRGLLIVEALCVRWDFFHALDGGKVVWAEIAIPPFPVTAAGLPQRAPLPGQYAPVININASTLRRVHRALKKL